MKKVSVLFSLALLAAMVLAACTGSPSNNTGATVTPGTTTLLTPVAGTTGTPAATGTTAAGVTGTPAAGMTGTPAATGTTAAGVTGTPTAGMTGTPAASGTPAVTGTPAAAMTGTATPQASTGGTTTPAMAAVFDRFSHYVGLPVQDTKGAAIGTMRGLVVMVNGSSATGSVPQTGSSSNMNAATSTPAAGMTQTPAAGMTSTPSAMATGTATPQASNSGSSTGSSSSIPATGAQAQAVDRIVYLAVKPDASLKVSGPGDLLIPWNAVNVSGAASTSGSTSGSTAATATPAAAGATQTPAAGMTSTPAATATTSASTSGGSTTGSTTATAPTAIVITVDAATVATAPVVTEEQIASGDFSAFISGLAGFWNSQGLSVTRTIPATGNTGTTTTSPANQVPLFLTADNYKNMQVVDQSSTSIGKTDDFIVDTANGMVQYFVFQGTGSNFAANGKFVIVPLDAASWQKMGNTSAGSSASAAGPQYQIVVNVPASAWANAPVAANWGPTFNVTSDMTWQSSLTSFWSQYIIK